VTSRAAFGDFARTVTWQLNQAQRRSIRLPGESGQAQIAREISAAVRRALHVMTGYAQDICRAQRGLPTVGAAAQDPWVRAADQAFQALASADAVRPAEVTKVDHQPDDWQADPRLSNLSAAVSAMMLGRDLLHTHLGPRDDNLVWPRSEWAPIVRSQPVASAQLHNLGGWASQLALYAGHTAAVSRAITPQDRLDLNRACQGLWVASWAVGCAQERQPVATEHLRLLEAVPVNSLPSACSPAVSEGVAGLCDGIIRTAERLRAAARRAASQAASSPALTRESLRLTAGCCAITSSNLRLVLRTLSVQHGHNREPLDASLSDSADAANVARADWLRVTEAWDSISTDTRGVMGWASVEAKALALWTGRLAYADPRWSPALGPRHEPRSAADLASSPDQVSQVVGAVHYTCHTLAQVAEADLIQARTASMTGRLVVPTRSLPDSFDVPYRFAPAPGTRSEELTSSYKLALDASNKATDAIAEIAAQVKAPSQVLTTLREVVHASPVALADRLPSQPRWNPARPGRERRPRGDPSGRCRKPMPPGPVERILLDLDVADKADLEQAAALDVAADQLILRAATATRPAHPGRNLSRSAGSAQLITRLSANTEAQVPAALLPNRLSSTRKPINRGLVFAVATPRRPTPRPSARPADPEAEAGA
jgi:hypothetical protein